MPRSYKRVSSRGSWSESDMKLAVEAVKEGAKLKTAAYSFNVPRTTLRRHVRGQVKKAIGSNTLGPTSIFSKNIEEEMVRHILAFEKRGFPLTVNDIRRLAYEFAVKNRIPNKFPHSQKMAGKDWWGGFRARHGTILTIRKPQPLSVQRAIHLNKPIVRKYFEMLETIMKDLNLFDQPGRIFNVDETGLSLVPGVKNIVGQRGSKYSSQITGGERGQSQTVVVGVNAVGDYIPPMIIFKGKRANPALERGLPAGSIVKYSESGYINKDLFLSWMEHFCKNVRSDSGKILLVVDGHHSHTHSLEVLEYALSHNIEMVSLPPHTSHYLQPLDKVHFKPLKDHFREAVRVHHRNNPGSGISRIDFPDLFSKAYYKVATVGNATTSFRATGLYPLDIEQIPEHAFAPSETTARETSVEARISTDSQVCSVSLESNNNNNTSQLATIEDEEEPCCSGLNRFANSPVNTMAAGDISRSINSRSAGSDISNESFEDILPLPKAPEKSKKPRKKGIQTGIRVLTGQKYIAELTDLSGTATTVSERAKSQQRPSKPKEKSTSKRGLKERGSVSNMCALCEGDFYDDEEDEGWIQCQKCHAWLHDICAGVYGKNIVYFECDDCSK